MKELKTLEDLTGLTISDVKGLRVYSDEVVITFDGGNTIRMYHYQDCSEDVYLLDVCGDRGDLIGGTVLDFREDSREATLEDDHFKGGYLESATWTFYNISTTKGSVNLRWLGESNGYYSEGVSIESTTTGKCLI